MANERGFFTPKSVFRGVNADGSKYRLTEWEPGSYGAIFGEPDGKIFAFVVTVVLMILAIPLILPIMLIYCMFTYNGRIQKTSMVGLIVPIYFLIDASQHWVIWMINSGIFGGGSMAMIDSIIIACFMGQIALVCVSFITKGSLYVNDTVGIYEESKLRIHPPILGIVTFIVVLVFSISNVSSTPRTTNQGDTYNGVQIQEPIELTQAQKWDAYYDYCEAHPSMEEQSKYREEHGVAYYTAE